MSSLGERELPWDPGPCLQAILLFVRHEVNFLALVEPAFRPRGLQGILHCQLVMILEVRFRQEPPVVPQD